MSEKPQGTEWLAPTAADRYAHLWERERPDLDAFLVAAEPLSAAERAAVLRVDQRQRWRTGERVPVDDYLRRLQGSPPDPDLVLDLIYNEFLVREQLAERPDPQDYCRRFPVVAATLLDQIALHGAIEPGDDRVSATGIAPPADGGPLPRPFGHYRLVKQLGQGGMGTVYLADDPRLGRQVALKVPRFDRDHAVEAAERFRREARAAAALRHPNLVPVYEVGQVDGADFFTMPYIGGEPLSARLAREGSLPEEVAIRLTICIAEAMEAVHRAGVLHRDLKPSNIMLDERGEPAIMDFGLARQSSADARVTLSGTVLGTPAYLAPEQLGCRADDMGPRCDIYSLGVILYELLTGRVPFAGSPGEVLVRVVSEDPAPPSRLRAGLNPRLEAVCLKAMARRAHARFASMAEFASALRGVAQAPRKRPHRSIRMATLLVVLALAATLVGWAVWATFTPWLGRATTTVAPTDPFAAGTVWTGRYVFTRPQEFGSGDTELHVTTRTGKSFAGTYLTRPQDQREYRWEVAGEADAGRVQWVLGKPLNANASAVRDQTKKATCTGTYDAAVLNVRFEDDEDQSEADVTLKLSK